LKDFPKKVLAALDIIAIHPDDFVAPFCTDDETTFCQVLRSQRTALKNPPKTVEDFLGDLENQDLSKIVSLLRSKQLETSL
jgi:hypothetical protein